jgi:hypothetical protein
LAEWPPRNFAKITNPPEVREIVFQRQIDPALEINSRRKNAETWEEQDAERRLGGKH